MTFFSFMRGMNFVAAGNWRLVLSENEKGRKEMELIQLFRIQSFLSAIEIVFGIGVFCVGV